MPNQEKYILVNLEDEKAKELANIIGNKTSRKILDYLSEIEEASESEISKELNLPLSTVHYNLQLLRKNKLVEVRHYMYSEKGKKIEFYSVVKKFIVIAPKYTRQSLIKDVVPLFLISAGISLIIQWLSNIPQQAEVTVRETTFQQAAPILIQTAQATTVNYYGLWFLAGAWVILIIYTIINLIKKRG